MKKLLISLVVLAASLLSSAKNPEQLAQLELFDRALSQVDLSTADLAFDLDDRGFYGGDRYRLPFFDALIGDPLKISPYVRRLTDNLLESGDDAPSVLTAVQARLNQGVRLGLIGDVLEPYRLRILETGDDCLETALAELFREAGVRSRYDEFERTAGLPVQVKTAAALFCFALPDVLAYREAALAGTGCLEREGGDELFAEVLSQLFSEEEEGEPAATVSAATATIEPLADGVDFKLLNTGATLLAHVVQALSDDLGAAADELRLKEFSIEFETPYGLIALNGLGHDRYDAGRGYLLVIDTRGDERYASVGATQSIENPVSVCIDLLGDDIYINADEAAPAFGAGVFGYGMLVDLEGDDEYNSHIASCGAGAFGVGMLCDYSGNDRYGVVAGGEGSGSFGTGVLIDSAGNDRYTCFQFSQGYGFTLGAGLLLDVEGDDRYIADDEDIRFPAAQSDEHNSSLSQGFGFGRRSDYLDGHSWAGGVGLLVDGAGRDSYSCGVFGQGCAYWYGVGILADKGGDDTYTGQWYALGSGAHFALGILIDDAGDDDYTGYMNMCGGAGHDFSLGWLEDRAGNDSYTMPNLSLGAGNANGIGVFWDLGGGDTYRTRGTTLGQASGVRPGSLRDFILTLGLFVDGGGNDYYLDASSYDAGAAEGGTGRLSPDAFLSTFDFCGNNMSWTRPGRSDPPLASEAGAGIDL